jgi:hypothetical protein
MKTLTKIPEEDEYLYAGMPWLQRTELNNILDNLPHLCAGGSLWKKCGEVGPAIGMEVRALYERVRKYLKTGDWLDLADRAKCGREFYREPGLVGFPMATREFVKGIFERFQRNNGAGLREIELILQTHVDSDGRHYAKIPGCERWPVIGQTPGWSIRNLRRFGPDQFDAKAARVGLFAASACRPPVFRTRVGLDFCRRVEFDDHEFNVNVPWPGQPRAMRPRGFFAAEALTERLQPSFKPTLWNGEKKMALTERDFQWFIVGWLTEVGYRTDGEGSWLVVERGTAAIREAFQERILRATNGQVKVARGGMFDRPAHGGQMGGKGAGNFRHKPIMEGAFNLIDNYFSGLPGQVGLNRLTCPEESGAREQYFGKLLKAAEERGRLGEASLPALVLPYLTWKEFMDRAMGLFAAINGATDHEIEGWAECGFHQAEFRLPMSGEAGFTPWQRREVIESMPEVERAALMLLVHSRDDLTRARNLSRGEAFARELARAREAGVMMKVTPWRYCDLMGLENSYPVSVTERNLFVIDNRDFGPGKLRYLAKVNGRHIREGEKFHIFVNPWSPQIALLCRDDGAAVGLVEQWETVPMANEAAQKRMAGKQNAWVADRTTALARRHETEAAELEHMREHNRALLESKRPAEEARLEEEERQSAEEALLKSQG